MTISILTPSYNYGRFLPTALDSVSTQSVEVEHVVVDGGSSDETISILQNAPTHVRWVSEADSGQSDALNKALALSSGDIVGWLNADDFYLPGALDAVEKFFKTNPQVDVMHGDVAFVNEYGKLQRLVAGYHTPLSILKFRGCVLPSTASFYRRDSLGRNPWDKSLRVVMDWDFFLRLHSTGARFSHISKPLAAFRLHSDQVTHEMANRDTHEHIYVRERWNAAPRFRALARHVGDLEHAVCKVASGALGRERRARHLHGQSLLDGEGRILSSAAAELAGVDVG